MEENYTISDVIEENNENLTNIIDSGIEAGVELAQDDGIDFTLECQISNGDSSEIESYKITLDFTADGCFPMQSRTAFSNRSFLFCI